MLPKIFRSMIVAILTIYALASIAAWSSVPVKVACIGDSITYGAGINDRDKNSYPAQLAVLLGSQWTVENFGVSGATLLQKGDNPYWSTDQYQAAKRFNPDVVVIKLGTNDSKPANWKYKSEYVADYLAMINSLRQLESKPTVLIVRPVPAYSDGWGISNKVIKEEILPLIDEVASKAGVKIIDLYSALSGKEELFPDKIHPGAQGAKLMAEIIAAVIMAEFPEDAPHLLHENDCTIAC
jgi:lysophospholipase L1-like esterase